MRWQINIKNIKINSISTLGSLNVGKTLFANNRSSSVLFQKPDYEENELDVEALKKLVPNVDDTILDLMELPEPE